MLTLEFNLNGYTELFIFENNLKIYLDKKMKLHYGLDWLKNYYPDDYSKCEFMRNQRINYLSNSTQNISLVSFLYFKRLREIIENEWGKIFYNDFKNVNLSKNKCQQTVILKLFEIEILRNTLSHSQPISEFNFSQLMVNIRFFKEYIPEYNEDLFGKNKVEDVILSRDQLQNLKDLVLNDNQITLGLIKYVENPMLRSEIISLSKMPRTRNIKASLEYCELKRNILEELNNLLGDVNV